MSSPVPPTPPVLESMFNAVQMYEVTVYIKRVRLTYDINSTNSIARPSNPYHQTVIWLSNKNARQSWSTMSSIHPSTVHHILIHSSSKLDLSTCNWCSPYHCWTISKLKEGESTPITIHLMINLVGRPFFFQLQHLWHLLNLPPSSDREVSTARSWASQYGIWDVHLRQKIFIWIVLILSEIRSTNAHEFPRKSNANFNVKASKSLM